MFRHAAAPNAKPTGFMISELIVVISLITILLGALLPGTAAMRKLVATKTAVHSIAMAVTTARAYATVAKADLQDSGDPDSAGFTYSGAAVLITPAGELRLVDNHQSAVNGSHDPLEPHRNGYVDIAGCDYVKLPSDAGVVGIARGGNLGQSTLYLLAPPFAVRYNEHGNLIAGVSSGHRVVYYDGNYDGQMTVSAARGEHYDPDRYDPNSPAFDDSYWHTTKQKYALPFEEIETVVGVIVYSKKALRNAGYRHTADEAAFRSVNANAKQWILANGQTLLFNRYTGTLMRRGAL